MTANGDSRPKYVECPYCAEFTPEITAQCVHCKSHIGQPTENTGPPSNQREISRSAQSLVRRAGKLGLASWLSSIAIVVAVLGFASTLYLQRALAKRVGAIEWSSDLESHRQFADVITPDVDVIQFLKEGYSITLDAVEPEGSDLVFSGRIGNPRFVRVTELTLQLNAFRPMYQMHEDWGKNRFRFLLRDPIASGESSIGAISAGGAAQFRLVVPRIAGTNRDSLEFQVEFRNARYQYLQ